MKEAPDRPRRAVTPPLDPLISPRWTVTRLSDTPRSTPWSVTGSFEPGLKARGHWGRISH